MSPEGEAYDFPNGNCHPLWRNGIFKVPRLGLGLYLHDFWIDGHRNCLREAMAGGHGWSGMGPS